MYTVTMRLAPPVPDVPADIQAIKKLVIASALPEDRLENIYVQAASHGLVDIVAILSLPDLSVVQVNVAALSVRLLRDGLPGWRLEKVWLEPTR
ncbi:MAG TPA: hypothetical protein VH637_00470 [Streptosporangiaceae bacterium]|jgi:hypothetical protein